MTESSQQNTSASSSSSDHSSERSTTGSVGGGSGSGTGSASLPVAGEIQPSLAFKRRPHLEMYIAKFIKSTSKTWKQYYDPLAEQHDLAQRIGTEAKSYEEWSHPEVNSRVKIECSTAEIYDSLIDLGKQSFKYINAVYTTLIMELNVIYKRMYVCLSSYITNAQQFCC